MPFAIRHSLQRRRGQSLIEVLVAVTIGVIMIIGAAAAIAPALKTNKDASRLQVAAALGKELLENVRVYADGNWSAFASLSTSSAHYYISTTSSPFTVYSGDEAVVLSTSTYIRYFTIASVGRDGSGNIVAAAGTDDPSTRKVSITYGIQGGRTAVLQTYVTRSRFANITTYTDWSGGPDFSGPASSTNARFSSSTGIDYSTTTGAIRLYGL